MFTTEAVTGGAGNGASRPTSPVPGADIAIEIDEDPPDAADSEPLVCYNVLSARNTDSPD